MTILTLKNKLAKLLCYVFVFTFLLCSNQMMLYSTAYATPRPNFTVVVDAGHGGVDTGCVGATTGVYESQITLKIAQKIQHYLSSLGINVVQTRTNMDGLYDSFVSGFKLRDLQKRRDIILKSDADLVVSIHLNSFADSSAHGAQVFYKLDSELSHNLADTIQALFVSNLYKARKVAMQGDYYILNCTKVPGILIECGFLSNYEEEQLLCTDKYLQKISYNISCGILEYFDLVKF